MFKTRLISGVFLVAAAVLILWLGSGPTLIVTAALSLIGEFELCRVYGIEKSSIGYIAYIWTILYYAMFAFDEYSLFGFEVLRLDRPMLVMYIIAVLSLYVIQFPKYSDKQMLAAYMAFFYVGVMLLHIYKIRNLENGGCYVVLLFLCSWGNDTLAYVTGRLFGRHKMSPVLSPKKSKEGLVGGIVGAGLLGWLYGLMMRSVLGDDVPVKFMIICALGAIPAVIGDLAASGIKRNNDVKDYGTIIPGHGGVLDRFDSMIFTAPLIYYLLRFAIHG